MKKYILKNYPQRFWHIADLEVYLNGELIETIYINKFYDVTADWFIEYDASGGSGIGWHKGEVIRKIYIGDSEFEAVTCN